MPVNRVKVESLRRNDAEPTVKVGIGQSKGGTPAGSAMDLWVGSETPIFATETTIFLAETSNLKCGLSIGPGYGLDEVGIGGRRMGLERIEDGPSNVGLVVEACDAPLTNGFDAVDNQKY